MQNYTEICKKKVLTQVIVTNIFLEFGQARRMIDEDKVGLKEKPEDTRYIKIRPDTPGVWAKDWIPNFAISCIGNCRLRNGQDHHSLEGPGRGWRGSDQQPCD